MLFVGPLKQDGIEQTDSFDRLIFVSLRRFPEGALATQGIRWHPRLQRANGRTKHVLPVQHMESTKLRAGI